MIHDKIIIKDLLIRGIIGINDWERIEKQDVLLNLTIFTNLQISGKSDNIDDTLNYRTLTKSIILYVENSKHYLVETLATEIAKIIIFEYNAPKVIIRLEKLGALRYAQSVGIEIERQRKDFDEQ